MADGTLGPGAADLQAVFDRIAGIGFAPGAGVTRLAASPADGEARRAFAAWMEEAGAQIAHDGIGNQFACFPWAGTAAPWVLAGSHLDSQPGGGRFDGALGVVSAGCAALDLEAARRAGSFRPAANLAVVNWTNEEGARFQPSLIGSSVYGGAVPLAEGLACRDGTDTALGAALAAIGVTGARGPVPPRPRAYLELHAEQGRRLADAGAQVGVVTGTWAARKMTVTWIGRAAHTGPTLMAERHDALLAAARGIAAFEDTLAADWPHLHRSAARLSISPNSPNVVVERASVWFELRHPSVAELETAGEAVRAVFARVAEASRTQIEITSDALRPPATMDPGLAILAAETADAAGFAPLSLASVAGHDAVALQNCGIPSALLFVPSEGGIAHHPDEFTARADMQAGLAVLTALLRRLLEDPAALPAER